MPRPGAGFPVPPFEWPRIGRQWPPYNVKSDQANGLVTWLPWGGGYPNTHQHVDQVGGLVFTEGGTPVWVGAGKRGQALLFNGSNEYLQVDDCSISAFPFTFGCWWYPTDDTVQSEFFYMGNRGEAGWWVALGSRKDGADFKARFRVASGTHAYVWDASGNLSVNTWYHILVRCTSATDYDLFRDGVKTESSGVDKNPVPSNFDRIAIARLGDSTPSNYSKGAVTDVRIYSHDLSDNDVEQLYTEPWELFQIPRRLWRLGVIVGGATYYQSCAGALTFAGGITRKTSKGLSGSITPAGGLVKKTSKVLAGTLTPTGSLVKKTSKSLTGAVTFAGDLVKKTSISVSGALTFVGSLGTSATFKQALSGALTFVGTLGTALVARQALSGAISFVGDLATQYTAGPGGAWIRWIDHRLLKWRKKFQ